MATDDRLRRVAVLLVLGKQPTEELVAIATDALSRGVDCPTLRELAGARPTDVREARDMFWRAMDELGMERPTPDQARWLLVMEWAEAIVGGRTDPVAGARRIWWEGWEELGRPEELTVFCALASEWEDDESQRDEYERDIIRAARDLIATRP